MAALRAAREAVLCGGYVLMRLRFPVRFGFRQGVGIRIPASFIVSAIM